jgi:putative transposase
MSRQNYYERRKERQRRDVDEGLIVELVGRERRLQPRLGGRKLHRMLEKELAQAGVKVGRDKFFEVLGKRGLLLEPQRAKYPSTTDSRHNLPKFGNQIKGLALSAANQVWVSDITYLVRQV